MIRHVGILGGGNISDTHARAASAVPGLAVAAVCGPNEAKVRAIAAPHRATPFTSVDDFLQHRPLDIVAIGSPSGLHGEQIAAAVRQGLHVLVEKPIEITTARVDEIVSLVEANGSTLGVFFQDRYATDLVDLADAIARGDLGRVTLAAAQVKWYRPPEYYSGSRWRGTWALDGGGALMNQGIHTVDLLIWLLGDVRRVYAKALTAMHAIEVEDTVVAVLEFASGAVATLEATTTAWPGYSRSVDITGTNGTIKIDHDRVVRRDLRSGEGSRDAARPTASPSAGRDAEAVSKAGQPTPANAATPVVADAAGHRRVFEDFVAALDAGRPPRVDAREARRSVALVRAIYESSRTGQPVNLP